MEDPLTGRLTLNLTSLVTAEWARSRTAVRGGGLLQSISLESIINAAANTGMREVIDEDLVAK